jgi:hypothetical protein
MSRAEEHRQMQHDARDHRARLNQKARRSRNMIAGRAAVSPVPT